MIAERERISLPSGCQKLVPVTTVRQGPQSARKLRRKAGWWRRCRRRRWVGRQLRFRRRLRRIVGASRTEGNMGLLKALLWRMPGVRRTQMDYGGCRLAEVEVELSDGYTLRTRDLFICRALRKAILAVAVRLQRRQRRPNVLTIEVKPGRWARSNLRS